MRWYLLTLAALLRAVSAHADAAEVSLDCPPLGDELKAQVEARLRATLLADGVSAVRIALTCPEFVATADVERGERVAQHRIASSRRALADALLGAADLALLEVVSPAPDTPPATSAAPESSPPRPTPKRAPGRAPPPPLRHYSDDPDSRARDARQRDAAPGLSFRAAALVEAWTECWGIGGSAGLEDGVRAFRYGFTLGMLKPTSGQSDFSATEVSGVVNLGVDLGGPQLGASAGLSALFAQPSNGLSGGSTDVLLDTVFGLDLSYPIWFGMVALTPGVGGRLFTADRRVVVRSRTELELSGFVAHASLGFAFRTDR